MATSTDPNKNARLISNVEAAARFFDIDLKPTKDVRALKDQMVGIETQAFRTGKVEWRMSNSSFGFIYEAGKKNVGITLSNSGVGLIASTGGLGNPKITFNWDLNGKVDTTVAYLDIRHGVAGVNGEPVYEEVRGIALGLMAAIPGFKKIVVAKAKSAQIAGLKEFLRDSMLTPGK